MSDPIKIKQLQATINSKDFLSISDFTKDQIMALIEAAITLKDLQKKGIPHQLLLGKTLAMIFEKSSTRTRVSFETGMFQLGGAAQFLSKDDLQLGNGETIGDTAQVLARYVDYIMIRTYGHDVVEEMAQYASVPVINGLTDEAHPCQVLSDLITIYETFGKFDGLKFTYVGDGNNMINSLMIGCAIMGIDCHIASPKGCEVSPSFVALAHEKAEESGAKIEVCHNPEEAVKDANIVYTDVWASMGWQGNLDERRELFQPYQVNDQLMAHANPEAVFMHCLPAKRGEEVTNEVIDSSQSIVFDQAENRLHAQKAILCALTNE
ncbi:MAG TPA: ornithine carbamoyltransferase [Pseudogracilibacillus sp.]|nr:ornithine carbamoyltransferase [Pseudogracilibacillus sp.]